MNNNRKSELFIYFFQSNTWNKLFGQVIFNESPHQVTDEFVLEYWKL